VDRPLREGGWPLLAPSALAYGARSPLPQAMSREDMDRVRDAFRSAAARAAGAGFDLVAVDMARGYLLGSFLSPLSNRRDDDYGGGLERRLRFPLEVLDAVRDAWPADRPVAVTLQATDWTARGLGLDDAVAVARALGDHGCDLIEVAAGWTVPWHRPEYGRLYLVPASDRVRNEAGVPTIAAGNLTTADEANTVLAAGRADLCLLDPRLYADPDRLVGASSP
jgi:anthraniloyl-CoA monooxygenase